MIRRRVRKKVLAPLFSSDGGLRFLQDRPSLFASRWCRPPPAQPPAISLTSLRLVGGPHFRGDRTYGTYRTYRTDIRRGRGRQGCSRGERAVSTSPTIFSTM